MMNILVTGVGAPGGPGIVKELCRAGHTVYGTDVNAFASGRMLCQEFFTNPGSKHADFVQSVLSFALDHDIRVIVPLVTLELSLFSKNEALFRSHGIHVVISRFNSLEKINDKGALYQEFAGESFVPEFAICTTAQELAQRIEQQLAHSDVAVVKPCVGNGSRGVRLLKNDYDPLEALLQQKPGSLWMNASDFMDVIRGKSIPPYLVSAYLPGDEYTCDVIYKEGRVQLALVRKRIEMRLGISISGEFVDPSFLLGPIQTIGARFELSGPIGLQFKMSETGTPQLVEINPRFQGTSVAAKGLGINYIDLAIRSEIEPNFQIPALKTSGVRFSRYYEEVFFS